MTSPAKPRAILSGPENIAVGMVGGVTETCLLMPVLTAKFCLQEGRPLPTSIGGCSGVVVVYYNEKTNVRSQRGQ